MEGTQLIHLNQARQALALAKSLSFAERAKLPAKQGLYLVANGSEYLYIGVAKNLRTRWHSHHRTPWIENFNHPRIYWIECSNYSFCRHLEKALIRDLAPKYNGYRVGFRSVFEGKPNEEFMRMFNDFLESIIEHRPDKFRLEGYLLGKIT